MTPQLAFLLSQCVNCLQSNNDHSAELFLKQAIKLAPNNPDVLRFFGIIEAKKQNFDIALSYFQKALKEAPKNVFVNSNIGNVLFELERYEEALIAYDKAISLDAEYAEAYNNKGNALQKLERYEEALSAYHQAISIIPDYAEAYCNKGIALHGLNSYQEALMAYDKTISINPNYAEAYSSKSKALQAIGRYGDALDAIKMATHIRPDYRSAHLDTAFLYFKQFDFVAGWDEYEWRWLAKKANYPNHISSKPIWDGKKTSERILILPEQGVGDKILFSSVFEGLKDFSPKVMVSTDARLLAIYRRSFPSLEFVDEKITALEGEHDLHLPVGSLFKYFRTDVESFGRSKFPYLQDDQDLTASLRVTLSQQMNEDRRINCGIAWRSANKEIGVHKTITISKLAPILALEKFKFVNLQYGDVSADFKALEEGVSQKIHRIPGVDLFDDLDGVLSLIQACDLILTCSNSVAHMAGALNKKTILMLPFDAGKFWYWHAVGGQSLCYPSIKLFSQSRQGSWDEVIEQVKAYMETLSFE